jgi:hypothetical protein
MNWWDGALHRVTAEVLKYAASGAGTARPGPG